METLSSSQIRTLIFDILQEINRRINDKLSNRPPVEFISQSDYDALVAADAVDPAVVYMIPEEGAADPGSGDSGEAVIPACPDVDTQAGLVLPSSDQPLNLDSDAAE